MTQQAANLLVEVLRLPEDERGELADKIMESLDPSPEDLELDPAWEVEILARVKDFEEGRVKGIPWPEARRLILEDSDASGTA